MCILWQTHVLSESHSMKSLSLLLALLSLLSLPLMAQEDAFYPAYHRVAGVAADDVLNLRAGPGASREIIGTLAPDASPVVVVGQSADGRWGLVRMEDGAGWASLRYLERLPGQDSFRLPLALNCSGTEPFWSLDIGPQRARYSALDGDGADFARAWDGLAQNMRPRQYGLRLVGDRAQLHAVITRGICSDGMSDRVYGFSISAILGGSAGPGIVTGCCALP